MRQEAFVARHAAEWDAFEQWLDAREGSPRRARATRRSWTGLADEDMPSRYRRLCQQQALARHRGYSPQVTARLQALMQRGHNVLYRPAPPPWRSALRFLMADFPRLVRAQRGCLWASLVLFALPLVVMYALLQVQPELAYGVMSPGQLAQMEAMYDPADVGSPIAPADERHPFHDLLMTLEIVKTPSTDTEMRHLRTQYFGSISAVDHEIGRLMNALHEFGLWDDTVVIVTSDHGEQLGDHGLLQKVGWFEESHHIPLIWRDPRHAGGRIVDHFTESVDVVPTLAETWDQPVPLQCDGLPLTPFLAGDEPSWWRDAATWEFDWRFALIPFGEYPWPWDRRLEKQHLTVRRDARTAFVQFDDGTSLCFDIAADPTWRTPVTDPARILAIAQDMLVWRSVHADRTLTGMLVQDGGVGRWPAGVPWRTVH